MEIVFEPELTWDEVLDGINSGIYTIEIDAWGRQFIVDRQSATFLQTCVYN